MHPRTLVALLMAVGVVAPAAAAPPNGYPAAGCNTIADPAGDGKATALAPVGPAPAVQRDDDPDLDITGVAINTTETDLVTYIRVAKLGIPRDGGGHQFTVQFNTSNKSVLLRAGENTGVHQSAEAASGSPTSATVNGEAKAELMPAVTFDKANSMVVVGVPLATLATAVGGTVGPGTTLTNLIVGSKWLGVPGQAVAADYAQEADVADRLYTVGDNRCFPPPPGVLANTGATAAQFTDAAAVAAKLTSAAGAALAGKTVTFAVGSRSVTATTDADGIAKAALDPGVSAGSYTLVTSFAGDAAASEVTLKTPFTVTVEKTAVTFSVSRSGTKRSVTATLRDDDRRAVAGQVVTWYVNGKKVSAPRTSSSGTVKVSAVAGQTVKAVFAAVSRRWQGSSKQAKV